MSTTETPVISDSDSDADESPPNQVANAPQRKVEGCYLYVHFIAFLYGYASSFPIIFGFAYLAYADLVIVSSVKTGIITSIQAGTQAATTFTSTAVRGSLVPVVLQD